MFFLERIVLDNSVRSLSTNQGYTEISITISSLELERILKNIKALEKEREATGTNKAQMMNSNKNGILKITKMIGSGR